MIAPDSSVVIAALAPWHVDHGPARNALLAEQVGLPAHVAFETVSALSRMPEGYRLAPTVVLEALEAGFPQPWLSLDSEGQLAALQQAVAAGVRGGALYDALIAATATRHEATLLSADRRAQTTYRELGADVIFLGGQA